MSLLEPCPELSELVLISDRFADKLSREREDAQRKASEEVADLQSKHARELRNLESQFQSLHTCLI